MPTPILVPLRSRSTPREGEPVHTHNLRRCLVLIIFSLLPWFCAATYAADPDKAEAGHAEPPGRSDWWRPFDRVQPHHQTAALSAAAAGDESEDWSRISFENWLAQYQPDEGAVRPAVQETRPLMPAEPSMPPLPQQSPQALQARSLIGQRTLGTTFSTRARRQLLARSAPPAIGDFFGGAQASTVVVPVIVLGGGPTFPTTTTATLPNPARPGTNVGRIKFAENGSAIPRDRVYFSHTYFDNVPLTPSGISVNRFAPGFEKTFLDGMMSAELRIPFATTLNSDILTTGATNTDDVEFGNILATLKALAFTTETFALAGGMQVALPTASDVTLRDNMGTELLHIDNESVHLMPFLASLYTPDDHWFLQGFLQLDIDANGNSVLVNDGTSPFVNTAAGRLDDKTYLFSDVSLGYWVYRSDAIYDRLTGVAPMLELHYSRSLDGSDGFTRSNDQGILYAVGDNTDRFDLLNFTAGLTFEFDKTSNLTLGYSFPLGGGADQDFDGEFRVFYTHRFGPPRHRNFVY